MNYKKLNEDILDKYLKENIKLMYEKAKYLCAEHRI